MMLKETCKRMVLTLPQPVQPVFRGTFRILQTWRRYALRPAKWPQSLLYHLGIYRMTGKTYPGLHLGCSNVYIEGFANIDAYKGCGCDIIAGVERIKLADNTVEVVYNSHVFEHIPRNTARSVIAEWYRVLKPGGKLYLCMPDIEALFRIYLDSLSDYDTPEGRYLNDMSRDIVYGGQTSEYDFHYNGYSFPTLKALLEDVGFHDVQRFDRKTFTINPNRDAGFAEIRGVPISLNIEAVK